MYNHSTTVYYRGGNPKRKHKVNESTQDGDDQDKKLSHKKPDTTKMAEKTKSRKHTTIYYKTKNDQTKKQKHTLDNNNSTCRVYIDSYNPPAHSTVTITFKINTHKDKKGNTTLSINIYTYIHKQRQQKLIYTVNCQKPDESIYILRVVLLCSQGGGDRMFFG